MRSMIAARPTTQPACGPPRSLSPLKETTSAPASIDARITGPPSIPYPLQFINDQRGLGARYVGEQIFGASATASARSGTKIEFQIAVAGGFQYCAARTLGQRRASQVRMQNHARCVDDAAKSAD